MSKDQRSSNRAITNKLDSPGPYIARVVNNIDPYRMGSLEVELLKTIGNAPKVAQQLFVVRYLSPFYGATDVNYNSSARPNDFNETQKSYGFWMVPPDTGTLVMVMFVESDAGQGYWMGCVPDTFMNHMIPGIAGSTKLDPTTRNQDEESWKGMSVADANRERDLKEGDVNVEIEFDGAESLPVAEVNRVVFRDGVRKYTEIIDNNVKPIHPIAFNIMKQGLIKDPTRGIHTSSVRRETPSNVFGISTPGPIDKRTGAKQGLVGRKDNEAFQFVSRLGGTQIVMDDGNDKRLRKTKPGEGPRDYADIEAGDRGGLVNYPEDEGFRIRTRTGHQILMSNSEDLIYIANSRGTAWIELTSNGKIDIYAQDSISLHSEIDFNLTADRDINLTAGGNINTQSIGNQRNNVGGSLENNVGGQFNSNVGDSVSTTASTFVSTQAGTNVSAQANNGDVKVASTGNTTFNVARDISFNGVTGVRTTSNGNVTTSTEGIITVGSRQYEQKVQGGTHTLDVDGGIVQKTKGGFYKEFEGDFHIKAKSVAFDADTIDLNSGVATASIAELNAGDKLDSQGLPHKANTGNQTEKSISLSPTSADGDEFTLPDSTLQPQEAMVAARVPQHEPWLQHENLNPQIYTPDRTRAGMQQLDSYGPYQYEIPQADGGGLSEQSFDPSSNGFDESEGGSGDTNFVGGGSGLTPRAKQAMDFYIGQGFNEAQAAAIVGNMQVESGANLDHTAHNTSGENSYGICQWGGKDKSRWRAFERKFGRPIIGSSFEQQLQFVIVEMTEKQSMDAGAARWFKLAKADTSNTADSAATLAKLFDDHFERSDKSARAQRMGNAKQLYEEFTRGANPSTNVPGSTEATVFNNLSKDQNGSIADTNSPQLGGLGSASGSPINSFASPGGANLQGRFQYAMGGTRNRPINDGLIQLLVRACHAVGADKVVCFSGRQPGTTGRRTGSTRHDTGDAADVHLIRGGRKVTDNATIDKFGMACVAFGARGLGHSSGYMGQGSVHVDTLGRSLGGRRYDRKTLTVWRSTGSFRSACNQGLNMSRNGGKVS